MQLTKNHPLYNTLKKLNDDLGPFLGLVLSPKAEKAFLESPYFVPFYNKSVTIAGRQFNMGWFRTNPTVYVLAGDPLAHVSVTTQIMIDNFELQGIIVFGGAATIGIETTLGDVAVINSVAYTNVWKWQKWDGKTPASNSNATSLRFGDYNDPEAGENRLSRVDLQPVSHYTPNRLEDDKTFFFPIHEKWHQIASQITAKLGRCYALGGRKICPLPFAPSIVRGVKASSSDIYLLNTDYGIFLAENLDISVFDRTSAAVVSTAIANGVPHIVFSAITNAPDVKYNKNLGVLTNLNTLKVVVEFVDRLNNYNSLKQL